MVKATDKEIKRLEEIIGERLANAAGVTSNNEPVKTPSLFMEECSRPNV